MKKAIFLLSAILPLSGCMTSGTNMHGDFSCKAPNGTCAPMSSIDATAVASISSSTDLVADPGTTVIPSGGRMVTASALDGASTPPTRTGERVLKVVFPAHVDAGGVYHDEASAHAVVERPSWTADFTGTSSASTVATVNVPTSNASRLATLDEVVAARAAGTSATPIGRAPPLTGLTPSAWIPPSRSVAPLNLREAIAGAAAAPVAGLDPPVGDTPDVTAALAGLPDPAAKPSYRTVRWHGRLVRIAVRGSVSGSGATVESVKAAQPDRSAERSAASAIPETRVAPGYRTVRWHGRKYSIPIKHPDTSGQVASALVSSGSRELNRAALQRDFADQSATSGSVVSLRAVPHAASASAVPPIVPSGPAASITLGNQPSPPTTLARGPAPTADAALAAKRVRQMAAPVIQSTLIDGRSAAQSETASLGNPFSALTGVASAPGLVGPRLPLDTSSSEPRP